MCDYHTIFKRRPATICSTMKNLVGPRIKQIRLRASPRVTQEELAARLQVLGVDLDRSALSRIERQTRLVTDLEITAICDSLGIGVADLFQ